MATPTETPVPGTQSNARAQHYFPRCGPLRAGKGLTKKELADKSGIDRSTLDKIESGKVAVTQERIMRVFNHLNDNHYGGTLKAAELITTTPPRKVT